MGSAAALEPSSNVPDFSDPNPSGMRKTLRAKPKPVKSPEDVDSDATGMEVDEVEAVDDRKEKKRNGSPNNAERVASRKMPKRAAACSNFKEKSFHLSKKSSIIENKKDHLVDDEITAVHLTSGPIDPRPCRRLMDFIFHDVDGNPHPVEVLEVEELFISGFILSLDESPGKKKEKGFKCEGFGRIESWAISGYEDGVPVIWVSTDVADYDCVKPAASYKKFYDHFSFKARACIDIYMKLSKSSGGSPDLTLDELLAGSVRSMSRTRGFPGGISAWDFLISQGEFIYNQLIGLDETSSKSDQFFVGLPALVALRDECKKREESIIPRNSSSSSTLTIKGVEELNHPRGSSQDVEDDEDQKLARLLQEEENWHSMRQKRLRSTSSSKKYYIKINENEIANDYPLPAYYKTTIEEMDEYIVFESDVSTCSPDLLPRHVLHNWSLYNSDSRLISLELLPMEACDEIDVTIFGSGVMTMEDNDGFCPGGNAIQSSSSASCGQETDGVPIYLSAIKEWMIEFGSDMVILSIRTDMSWYRLGKPSKQYAPWCEVVLKTSRLAICIIALLEDQTRICRLPFADVIKKVAEFEKDHPAYISSNPSVVERYVVVHGQIIVKLFSIFPNESIKKCVFVTGLLDKMEERRHTKLVVNKKNVVKSVNLNPRAALGPVISKRKAMQATTTRLINKIWGEYYSNYSPEALEERDNSDEKQDEDVEEPEENEEVEAEEKVLVQVDTLKTDSTPKAANSRICSHDIRWDGEPVGRSCAGDSLYACALVHGEKITVGGAVIMDVDVSEELQEIYFVEYMFETSNGRKMVHGIIMEKGSQTVLGNAANEREVFLTNRCTEFELGFVKQTVNVDIRLRSWGYQHRKENAQADRVDRSQAEERKSMGLPIDYYCKSLYWPQRGAFFTLPTGSIGLGTGVCRSCQVKETQTEKEVFKVNPSKSCLVYNGVEYSVNDFVYVNAYYFETNVEQNETFKSGRNVGLKAYAICCLLSIDVSKTSKQASVGSTHVKVRRFFRPEDISPEKAYASDVREVYYSDEEHSIPVEEIEGKCEIRRKHDLPSVGGPAIYEHIFFCEHQYDPAKGTINQLPGNIKLKFSTTRDAAFRKKKGKCKEGESENDNVEALNSLKNKLATLDIFAGCGGLSEGLEKSGASLTKWAIEYEEPAGEAFLRNHPDTSVFVDNCNVILKAIMEKCGDTDDCISTTEASDLAAKLSEEKINNLPLPGQVDFINGGPPCQGFSGMNRFNQSTWSKVQCEMILAFLSFADYFRPRFFLLENVRNFVSFNKGQTFRLTLASLLEMGYQVRFGVLEAGAYGVSQSRKRAFIWAAAPQETLPEWPEPMHVFASPELKIALPGDVRYAAVCSTAGGAPFRAITVRDTIGDLPPVENGAAKEEMAYKNEATSWFQRQIRGEAMVLSDHISKEMNELNFIRCQRIPKRPGADWRDLPDEKVKLSNGQVEDLIPWCLPNTAKRHNQWKGLFGRLDWEGNFPTSITDPQPMGKVGMCFHPDQDRILTVRECARSQGFRDSYIFAGNIQSKHRQIGNAVPPPLAFALGRKLKEAIDGKLSA
ncbi:hypothetical protein Syun_025532 [Stephania yunnanensis]|uniref:DNA (cytosine-5)-methyltransferase n=1 Tax=Stephania yunnanensis TaxID=152371 RepID=A0AAP0HUY2_9MAGN